MSIELEYPLIIYISVGLVYGLGIAVSIVALIKAWLWAFDKTIIFFKIKKKFIEFVLSERRKN